MTAPVISPTIGRVVLFWDSRTSRVNGAQAMPALVCHVWNDRNVNVGGFGPTGAPFSRCSVPLLQDGDEAPEYGPFAEWMPYQKGQAAKAEALQAQLAQQQPTTV
jgi:hypothetical protein